MVQINISIYDSDNIEFTRFQVGMFVLFLSIWVSIGRLRTVSVHDGVRSIGWMAPWMFKPERCWMAVAVRMESCHGAFVPVVEFGQ